MRWWRRLVIKLLPRRAKEETDSTVKSTGGFRSPRDPRDYSAGAPTTAAKYPARFSITTVSRVENQGRFNSCVAQAVTTALETLAINLGWPSYMELSRMHCWNKARQLTWGVAWRQNKGVYIRDGWKAAANGVTLEKLFPYRADYFERELHPSWVFAWYPAFVYRFIKVNNKEERLLAIKQALFDKRAPVVFGIKVGRSFKNPDGKVVYKPPFGEPGSGHAMLITGWDDDKGAFLVRNSWGRSWGVGGSLWVSYDWVLERAYDISYAEEKK